jgi:hypothetical protein
MMANWLRFRSRVPYVLLMWIALLVSLRDRIALDKASRQTVSVTPVLQAMRQSALLGG